VIGSEYTISVYVHIVPRQNPKANEKYLLNAHRQKLKTVYHYNKNLVMQYLIHDWLR